MIRKESSAGIGYSVVDLGGVRHIFASAVPRSGVTVEEQTCDALHTIEAVFHDEGTRGSIVQQSVFMKDITQIDSCRGIIKNFYGENLPATAYIPQAPCEGKLLEIEALGVGRQRDGVELTRICERMVVVKHDGIQWVHLAQVCPETTEPGIYERSFDGFRIMAHRLARRGYRYDQVVRTWLYLGDIVGPEGETQRYKELNRARTDFYTGLCFGTGRTPATFNRVVYPASTGIGADGRDVMMSCIAMATERTDVTLVPLENPLQTAAFDYGSAYSPKSPKFSRAMAIVKSTCPCATVMVSGTASITQSETQYVGDPEGQTWQTLDNIAALISRENFCRHGVRGPGATLDDMALVRVYIKRQEDYRAVRTVCEARLGELPIIYAVADVCRPELLVEIEGIAFACPDS